MRVQAHLKYKGHKCNMNSKLTLTCFIRDLNKQLFILKTKPLGAEKLDGATNSPRDKHAMVVWLKIDGGLVGVNSGGTYERKIVYVLLGKKSDKKRR